MRATATARERVASAEERVRDRIAQFIVQDARASYEALAPGQPAMIVSAFGSLTMQYQRVARTAEIDFSEDHGFEIRYALHIDDTAFMNRLPERWPTMTEAVGALRLWVDDNVAGMVTT